MSQAKLHKNAVSTVTNTSPKSIKAVPKFMHRGGGVEEFLLLN
jgi:hypothetical protein